MANAEETVIWRIKLSPGARWMKEWHCQQTKWTIIRYRPIRTQQGNPITYSTSTKH